MKKSALILPFVLTIWACDKAEKPSETTNATPLTSAQSQLPNTPEEVVRAWEENVNKNQFDVPRLVSREEALELVNSVAASDEESHLEIIPMEILSLQCQENGDFASCSCTLKDDFGKRAFRYALTKTNGQWFLTNVEDMDEAPAKVNQKPSRDAQ